MSWITWSVRADLGLDAMRYLVLIDSILTRIFTCGLPSKQVVQMYHAVDIDASGYVTGAELLHFIGGLGISVDDGDMEGQSFECASKVL